MRQAWLPQSKNSCGNTYAQEKPQSLGSWRAVGRESEAHPAFRIIPFPDAERHHLPSTQGYKYHLVGNGENLNKANPPPSPPDRALPDCGCNPRDAHSHPRRRWRVPQNVATQCIVRSSAGPALKVFPRREFGRRIGLKAGCVSLSRPTATALYC
jgi:hypothetical protein